MIEFDTDGTKCAMCIGEMTSGHLIGLLSQKKNLFPQFTAYLYII